MSTDDDVLLGKKGEDLSQLSKPELLDIIRKLQCHVKQLRNIVSAGAGSRSSPEIPSKKRRVARPFDFSRHGKRHVALKISYFGWNYQGLAVQEDTDQTIEDYVFGALHLTKLIESRETSNYHRCGRTDKGVSSFSQVISIDLRSNCKDVNQLTSFPHDEELNYCKMLNRVLPKDIRVLAWASVAPEFSARFDCSYRTYRYLFPKGVLDLKKMKEAAQHLIGNHDFRNFCKEDKSTPGKSTVRTISSIDIHELDDHGEYTMCQLVICGQSFIWHQIRCIVAVLILIGQEMEDPGIVMDLLNLQKCPHKPQYSMAVDYPLNLYDVSHGNHTNWVYNVENISCVLSDIQSIWAENAIRGTMALNIIQDLESKLFTIGSCIRRPCNQVDCLLMGTKCREYQKLLDRPKCHRSS